MPTEYEQREAITAQIAEQLGESGDHPLRQIRNLVRLAGEEFTLNLLQETLDIEAQGGMMTGDGARRRTPGGVFFYLARQQAPPEVKKKVFPPPRRKKKKKKPPPQQAAPPPQPKPKPNTEPPLDLPPFQWGKRALTIVPLLAQAGKARGVALRLVGRPDLVDDRFADFAVMAFHHETQIDLVPQGVPTPAGATTYTLFVRAEQWPRIAKSLADDLLDPMIAEGPAFWDEATNSVICLAADASTQAIRHGKKMWAGAIPPHAGTLPFSWAERVNLLDMIWGDPGTLETATVTISGRPWKTNDDFDRLVVAGWHYTPAPHDIPGGAPDPVAQTHWMAYIARKQWRKVADDLADRNKALAVQGYVMVDPDIDCLAIFTTGLRSIEQPRPPRRRGKQPGPPPPSDPAAQLAALQQREAALRGRLDALLDRPAEEQAGLGDLLAALRQVKVETKALFKQYPYLRAG